MARMLPPCLSDEVRSAAERRIFSLLETDPETHDWVVLHSLGLARHVKRIYGEIDFVVLAPKLGVVCLEVKGGRISRQDGTWTFTDRFGSVSKKTLSPFMQAREGMFSLLNAVKRHFGSTHPITRLLFAYGVMFPDINFNHSDPEYDKSQVYDLSDRRFPVSRFITRLAQLAGGQLGIATGRPANELLPSSSDISALLTFLRGDFDLVVSATAALRDTDESLLRLTTEQYGSLDQLQDNRRCLFEGAAGTGKTLLAMELARRESSRGNRVALLCYNRLLGSSVQHQLEERLGTSASRAVVGSFHRFLHSLIMQSSQATAFADALRTADETAIYTSVYPLYALLAIDEGSVQQFDVLIVDEGQDLIYPDYLDVLDALLVGGLNGGRWAIFCDFHRQAIFSELTSEAMISQLESRVSRYTRFRLSVNCRNTKPIGEETALVSGFETPPFLPAKVTGPPVEYLFFSTIEEERGLLAKAITNVLTEGVPAGSITILSPVVRENSCLANPLKSGQAIANISDLDALQNRKSIGFTTIQSFKGLENSVIIMIDIDDLTSERGKSLLYVGMSRARHRLILLVSKAIKSSYVAAIQRGIKRVL
jgi:hypothetical protein